LRIPPIQLVEDCLQLRKSGYAVARDMPTCPILGCVHVPVRCSGGRAHGKTCKSSTKTTAEDDKVFANPLSGTELFFCMFQVDYPASLPITSDLTMLGVYKVELHQTETDAMRCVQNQDHLASFIRAL
jgi:hypothetical protein